MLRVPVQKLARWQRTPISAPLLSLEKAEERADAVRIFKVILRVCGDRDAPVFWPSVPEPAELGYGTVPKRVPVLSGGSPLPDGSTLAGDKLLGPSVREEQRWLLEKGILSSPALRDEVYVQCLKQMTDNPGRDSFVLAWQLLGTLLVCFPPSKEASSAGCAAANTRSEDDATIIGILARHAASRLASICQRGPRGRVPSLDEVEYAMDAAFAPSVFGQSLDIVMDRQKEAYPDVQVPIALVFLCDGLLALNAHKRAGLFRLTAEPALVTTLRLRLDRGHYSLDGLVAEGEDGETLSAVLVSTLKLFLRELDPPLVPSEAYQTALGASHNPARVVEHVLRLPSINIRSLAYLIKWLQGFCTPKVAAAAVITPEALAAAFAPNLLRDPRPSTTLEEAAANSNLEARYVLTLLRDLPCQALLRGK
ncbi:Rho GTPase activation protein, partial [Tilletiopsis washingtonensis]